MKNEVGVIPATAQFARSLAGPLRRFGKVEEADAALDFANHLEESTEKINTIAEHVTAIGRKLGIKPGKPRTGFQKNPNSSVRSEATERGNRAGTAGNRAGTAGERGK